MVNRKFHQKSELEFIATYPTFVRLRVKKYLTYAAKSDLFEIDELKIHVLRPPKIIWAKVTIKNYRAAYSRPEFGKCPQKFFPENFKIKKKIE